MIDGNFRSIPVLIITDFDDHGERFICNHDFVERGSYSCEVLVLVAMLVHLNESNRHALLRIKFGGFVCVTDTGATC